MYEVKRHMWKILSDGSCAATYTVIGSSYEFSGISVTVKVISMSSPTLNISLLRLTLIVGAGMGVYVGVGVEVTVGLGVGVMVGVTVGGVTEPVGVAVGLGVTVGVEVAKPGETIPAENIPAMPTSAGKDSFCFMICFPLFLRALQQC
jgi:hypothetical protein